MKILLTNDDGINSPGLKTLEEKLIGKHEIIVVAPAEERSGSSNSLSFHGNIKIIKIDDIHYSCSGTPADCVHRTLHGIIGRFSPDIVVSGINVGPNLGTDIIYSGTAAAARQAALMGVPGDAVTVTSHISPIFFEKAALFVADNLETFYSNWNEHHFININVPSTSDILHDVMITEPARRFYEEHVGHGDFSKNGSINVTLEIKKVSHDDKYGTDCYAVDNGMISISPVLLQPLIDADTGNLYKNIFSRGSHG
ncbi:MAG: 5'/3'-nucleotidase SurE [Spirochaetia bacterium]|jgi:5'-nucleotidase|nr:5'/3'-nucleotidase SurE [Spirochaetia bacterium]